MGRLKRKPRPNRGFKIQRERRRVSILTPCDDTVKTFYATSLLQMMQVTIMAQPESLEGVNAICSGSSILPESRQKLADQALEAGATHLLWIDSDMKFPPDTLLRFLKRDEKIIGINAVSRRPPYVPCAQMTDGSYVITNKESSGLEKVGRMGFGVLWVAAEVFKEMTKPYFAFDYMHDKQTFRGEDYFFFHKTRQLGFEAYVDHDLSKEVLHLGTFGFHPLLLNGMGDQ